MHWLTALAGGSFAYALADILCDTVIAEQDDANDTAEELEENAGCSTPARLSSIAHSTPGYRVLAQETPGAGVEQRPAAVVDGLTGTQDGAISGLVTTVGLAVSFAIQLSSVHHSSAVLASLKWRPHTHFQFWFACLGGACSFYHNLFLLKAFENAPSTVLLPLIQVASVSVLLGSSVLAMYKGEPFITPIHALAYALMFMGGLLPAVGGQLHMLLSRTFWKQRYVVYAVASELMLGLHDLLLSGCAYERRPAAAGGTPAPDGVESFEFVVWSRIAFVVTFVGTYLCHARLRAELCDLLSGRVRAALFTLSCLSELLALGGCNSTTQPSPNPDPKRASLSYYLVSVALGSFYQPALVHAAEASLSQCLNLVLAYLLLKGCGVGRDSAVGSMGAKSLSLAMVTVGLVVASLEDGGQVGVPQALPAHGAPQLGAPFDGTAIANASAGSAAFYAKYPHFAPVVHSLRGHNAYGRPWRHHHSRRARKAARARGEYFFPPGIGPNPS